MLGITPSAPPTSDQRKRIDAAIERFGEWPTSAAAATNVKSVVVDIRVMSDAPWIVQDQARRITSNRSLG